MALTDRPADINASAIVFSIDRNRSGSHAPICSANHPAGSTLSLTAIANSLLFVLDDFEGSTRWSSSLHDDTPVTSGNSYTRSVDANYACSFDANRCGSFLRHLFQRLGIPELVYAIETNSPAMYRLHHYGEAQPWDFGMPSCGSPRPSRISPGRSSDYNPKHVELSILIVNISYKLPNRVWEGHHEFVIIPDYGHNLLERIADLLPSLVPGGWNINLREDGSREAYGADRVGTRS
jgi:hypothetical protein